ncbi:glutathione S-transferase family protein [Roseiterribacter gracilis]|uniref:Glutathione S-transferase n=1 Tax=Roseiterribacter gracilis TaxID=2812848 RepID=A0A8S8X9S6_9PROT|nr:glutathione S-transferase [Rhodospirillales bacterium TMPK1]
MALVLHSHPVSAYCWKVLIALYENGTPFDLRLVNLGDPSAKAAFEALWPTGKIPLLEDDGRVVAETSIQIEHLDRTYPGKVALLPADAQLEVRLWDRLFDCYVMTPMQDFVAQHLRPGAERDARTLADMQTRLRRAYDLIEARMPARPWAASADFSMADCAAAPSLFYAACVLPFPPTHTKLIAYYERLMARPSVQRVLEDARPFFQYFPLRDALPARFRDAA